MNPSYTVFSGPRAVFAGTLPDVAAYAASRHTHPNPDPKAEPLLVFADQSGSVVDLDLRGSAAEVVARARAECAESEPAVVPGKKPVRGRPRLGVEAKEVALLPKHWAWLQSRPKSASATLRLLVEEKMKASTRATRRSECARANHAWTLG